MRQASNGTDLFAGGGSFGRLMRAHDWSAMPLGPVDGWPQSLKTAVRIMRLRQRWNRLLDFSRIEAAATLYSSS
jgi:hypothetical protein